MVDPVADALARKRWAAITALRAVGAAMIVVGLLIVNGAIALPHVAGYVLVGIGLADTFVMPQFLARKWRTPKP